MAAIETAAFEGELARGRRTTLEALVGDQLAGRDVLDLGCGEGDFAELLVELGLEPARLIGWDRDAARVERARARFPAARFEHRDLVRETPEASSYDLVVLSQVLSQLPEAATRTRLLEGAASSLRAGGRLLIHEMRHLRPRARRRGLVRFGPRELEAQRPATLEVIDLRTCTLLPPLLRWVAPCSSALVASLESWSPLRGHYMALLGRRGA